MQNQSPTAAADSGVASTGVAWESLENRSANAFMLAGTSLLASALVPVALQPVTDLAWVSGLVLVALAVLGVAVGLFGLYPRLESESPVLAGAGVLSAVVAGVGALGMLALAAAALVGGGAMGLDLGKPVGAFFTVSLAMAGGYSLGFVFHGLIGVRTGEVDRRTSWLLLVGGGMLLVPMVGEVLRRVVGLGLPQWLFIPGVLGVALSTLSAGYSLRSKE